MVANQSFRPHSTAWSVSRVLRAPPMMKSLEAELAALDAVLDSEQTSCWHWAGGAFGGPCSAMAAVEEALQ